MPQQANEKTLSVILRADNSEELPKVIAKLSTAYLEKTREVVYEATKTYWALRRKIERAYKAAKPIPVEWRDELEAMTVKIDNLEWYPTLRTRRNEDEQGAKTEIALLIIWLTKQVNVTANMTRDQITTLATEILYTNDWTMLRVEDLAIIFREALKGKYGPIYNRLDGQMVRTWIETYAEQLKADRMQREQNEYLALKEQRITRAAEKDRDGLRAAQIQNIMETYKREQE